MMMRNDKYISVTTSPLIFSIEYEFLLCSINNGNMSFMVVGILL